MSKIVVTAGDAMKQLSDANGVCIFLALVGGACLGIGGFGLSIAGVLLCAVGLYGMWVIGGKIGALQTEIFNATDS